MATKVTVVWVMTPCSLEGSCCRIVPTCYFGIPSSFVLKTEVTRGFFLTIVKAPKRCTWSPGKEGAEQLDFIFHTYFRNKKKF
jgi:hypothetical protein